MIEYNVTFFVNVQHSLILRVLIAELSRVDSGRSVSSQKLMMKHNLHAEKISERSFENSTEPLLITSPETQKPSFTEATTFHETWLLVKTREKIFSFFFTLNQPSWIIFMKTREEIAKIQKFNFSYTLLCKMFYNSFSGQNIFRLCLTCLTSHLVVLLKFLVKPSFLS